MSKFAFREPPSYLNVPSNLLSPFQLKVVKDYLRDESLFAKECERIEAEEAGLRERLASAVAEAASERAASETSDEFQQFMFRAKVEAIEQERPAKVSYEPRNYRYGNGPLGDRYRTEAIRKMLKRGPNDA